MVRRARLGKLTTNGSLFCRRMPSRPPSKSLIYLTNKLFLESPSKGVSGRRRQHLIVHPQPSHRPHPPELHDPFVGASYRQFRDKSPFWDFVDSSAGVGVGDISVGDIRHPQQPPRCDFGPGQAIDFRSSIRESSLFASALPQDKNVFVPTGALIYRPSVRVMTYASHARGFEKGDYAPCNANSANLSTAPTTV